MRYLVDGLEQADILRGEKCLDIFPGLSPLFGMSLNVVFLPTMKNQRHEAISALRRAMHKYVTTVTTMLYCLNQEKDCQIGWAWTLVS